MIQETKSGATWIKHYLHTNHLYSVAAVTDANGTVVERYRFDAFGKRTVLDATGLPKSGNGVTSVAFTGRTIDDETGLLYFRARQYSTTMGRFVGRDPKKFIDGMSLYFAYFSPNGLDPEGTSGIMSFLGKPCWPPEEKMCGPFGPSKSTSYKCAVKLTCCGKVMMDKVVNVQKEVRTRACLISKAFPLLLSL